MAAVSGDGVSDAKVLDERDARALTEYMSVLPDGPRAKHAPGLYLVVSQSGSAYLVDHRDGRCECWNDKTTTGPCKHRRRVAFATGEREIPAWVDDDAVDDQLGEHVNGDPHE